MKFLLIALLVPFSALAAGSFENKDYSDVCKGYRVSNVGEQMDCFNADSYRQVKNGKVGENTTLPRELWAKMLGAIELSLLPDADTNQAYSYIRKINYFDGTQVGYMQTQAFYNSEMEVSLKMKSRYNLKGDLVTVYVEWK